VLGVVFFRLNVTALTHEISRGSVLLHTRLLTSCIAARCFGSISASGNRVRAVALV
jgi:hypothetical protein